VITVQLQVMFACLYYMMYNSFLSSADLQQIFIFVFLVILGKFLACLDEQASLNGVSVKLVSYVVLVSRTWIYTVLKKKQHFCFQSINKYYCLGAREPARGSQKHHVKKSYQNKGLRVGGYTTQRSCPKTPSARERSTIRQMIRTQETRTTEDYKKKNVLLQISAVFS